MEYQVPQFVEMESKIVGPLTLKQFVYIAGGAGLCIALLRYLPIFIALILCIPVVAFSGALAFYKINNKPFVSILEAGTKFYTSSKMFLWRKEASKPNKTQISVEQGEKTPPTGRLITQGKLHELAWSLDVNKNEKPTQSSS